MGREARARARRRVEVVASDVETLLAYVGDQAREQFRRAGQVTPTVYAVTSSGRHLALRTSWPSREAKAASLLALRQMFREQQVVRYGIMTEVWMAPNTPHDTTPPGERANRREAIHLAAVERGGPALVAMREIIRPWDGSHATLGPLVLSDPGAGGELLELLEDEP